MFYLFYFCRREISSLPLTLIGHAAKIIQDLAQFFTTSDYDDEYIRNVWKPKIAKAKWSTAISFTLDEKGRKVWSTNHKVRDVHFEHPNRFFRKPIISAPIGCWVLLPQIFTLFMSHPIIYFSLHTMNLGSSGTIFLPEWSDPTLSDQLL